MTSFVEPIFFGDLLVRLIGAAFVILLAMLSVATLLANGWGVRRTTLAAIAIVQRGIALGAARRQRWRANASATSAQITAVRNQPALAQRNLGMKMIGVVRRKGGALPSPREARPLFDLGHERRFAGRLEELAGLYLSPPEHAVVFCCDDSRPLQAVTPHRHDLRGTTPLSEAVSELVGSVIGSCDPGQRHLQWLTFLRQLDRQTPPAKQLRVLCDNPATQQHPSVRRWLSAHPRIHVEFASSSEAGLRMVRRFVDRVIAEQLGVRAFHSVAELTAAISRHVKIPVSDAAPFTWMRSERDAPAARPLTAAQGAAAT